MNWIGTAYLVLGALALVAFVGGLFPARELPSRRERAPTVASDATTATVRARP